MVIFYVGMQDDTITLENSLAILGKGEHEHNKWPPPIDKYEHIATQRPVCKSL